MEAEKLRAMMIQASEHATRMLSSYAEGESVPQGVFMMACAQVLATTYMQAGHYTRDELHALVDLCVDFLEWKQRQEEN